MDKIKSYSNIEYETTRTLKLVYPYEPIGAGRPRFSARNGVVRAYDPEKSREAKEKLKAIAEEEVQKQGWTMASEDAPISLEVHAYCRIPKTKQQWFKEAANMDIITCLSKPDNSNILKWIEDAMNNVVYKDDKAIFNLHVTKHYSENPRIEIFVTKLYINLSDVKTKALAHKKSRELKEND